MNKAIKNKWVAVLRSDEYYQIHEMLRNTERGRCCLGVLADVNGEAWIKTEESPYPRYVEIPNGHFSASDYHGRGTCLTSSESGKLINLNDKQRLTFDQIATYIENNL